MHWIKISLCAEVAAFFIAWKKIILCNCWDIDAEFATGFIYLLFIFGSAMVKIIKCIFPPRRSWKIYFLKFYFWMQKLQHWNLWRCPSATEKNYKKYFFLPEGVGKIIKSIFCLWMRKLQHWNLWRHPSTTENFIKNIFSSRRSRKNYKKYFLSLCYFIFSATCI